MYADEVKRKKAYSNHYQKASQKNPISHSFLLSFPSFVTSSPSLVIS